MRMRSVFSVLGVLICFVSGSNAIASWGSSGGGEIVKDALNPWWLRNIKEVAYCIEVDSDSISIAPDKIPALVETAIQYWKKEFSRKFPLGGNSDPFNKAGVATQYFRLTHCNEAVDLKIQLGYGTLTDQQKKSLPDLNRFVGIVIRTDYDEINMRGRGFIYIASDRGPHKYADAEDLADQPWSHPKVLTEVLMHEFGHVFGVPHSDRVGGLMYYLFPELSLSKNAVASSDYINFDEYPSQFVPPTRFLECFGPNGMSQKLQTFFGIHSSAQCLDYRAKIEKNELDVFLRQTPDKPSSGDVQIGRITGLQWDLSDILSVSGFVLVYLDHKQKVFASSEVTPGSPFPYVVAQLYLDLVGTQGVYRSIEGASAQVERPLMIKLSPMSNRIYGLVDGKIDELYGSINVSPPEVTGISFPLN